MKQRSSKTIFGVVLALCVLASPQLLSQPLSNVLKIADSDFEFFYENTPYSIDLASFPVLRRTVLRDTESI